MSNPPSDPGHGDSPAAWTAVIVMLIGVAVGTIAFFMHQAWLVWASGGVVLLGAILGFVLAKAGLGVNGSRVSAKTND